MANKVTGRQTKICAMCKYWNGPMGGSYVLPKANSIGFVSYESNEKQVCFKNHFVKEAWMSCNYWENRY